MRNITRIEATERADLLHVDGYEIDLDFTTGDERFGSTTTARFGCRKPGSTTFIELVAPRVRSIRLNGRKLAVDDAYDGERIRLDDLAADNELTVEAEAEYSASLEGLQRFVDPEDGRVYLYSECFVIEAQRIFACFDQPDLKAPITLRVAAPDNWIVTANGAAEQTGPGRWAFSATPPISTYLFAVCAGPYHSVMGEHRGIPLAVRCRQSLVRYLEADDMLADAGRALDFFAELFGRPYPFEKCDLMFVPEMGGAMENVACITIIDDLIFRSPVTDSERRTRTEFISHELAHMWFGDLVTLRWWDDLWLNESFAEYLANLMMTRASRHRSAWMTFALRSKTWGYWADQLPTTHPIAADVPDAVATMMNLDGISYAKGAGALKQLVAWVGFEPFTRGLRAYIAENAFGNTSIGDLLGALEKASGRNLRAWSKEWLQTAGVVTLRPETSVDESGRFTRFAVGQTAAQAQPSLRSHRIAIGLYDREESRLVRRERFEVDIVGASTEVPALVGLKAPDLLVLNDEDLTWAKTRLDEGSLAAVLDGAIPQLDDPVTRAVVWLALNDMLLDAELPVGDYVRVVTDGLAHEPEIGFVVHQYKSLLLAINRLGDATRRDERMRALAERAYALALAAPAGSDGQLAHAKAFVQAATDDRQAAIAREWLAGEAVPDGLAISPDLRWQTVLRLAARGLIGSAEIDAEQARDDTSAGAERAATARASLPDAAAKEQTWSTVFAPEPPSLGILRAMAAGFWRAEQVDLCRPYVERYVPEIAVRFGGESQEVARILAVGLFPMLAVEPATLRAIDAGLEGADLNPSFRRILLEGRADLQRAIRTRELDLRA